MERWYKPMKENGGIKNKKCAEVAQTVSEAKDRLWSYSSLNTMSILKYSKPGCVHNSGGKKTNLELKSHLSEVQDQFWRQWDALEMVTSQEDPPHRSQLWALAPRADAVNILPGPACRLPFMPNPAMGTSLLSWGVIWLLAAVSFELTDQHHWTLSVGQ